MLRTAVSQLSSALRVSAAPAVTQRVASIGAIRLSHGGPVETDEQFDARYVTYFSRTDIDGWEVRKGMNDILGMDLIPDPVIISAALKACRRVNDYALAVRWLEGCKDKCGSEVKTIYPYLLQEIRPTLEELGVLTPEEMGYGVPELALKTVYEV